MKTSILIAALLLTSVFCYSQKCRLIKSNENQIDNEPTVTVGVIADVSLKPMGRVGFTGMGVHVGVWAGNAENWPNLGVFVGYVESKLNDSTIATRNGAATLSARIFLFEKHLQLCPFFAAGTNNYQDIGFRLGVKVNDGVYLGGIVSRMMHYGVSVQLSIFKN